VKKAEDHREERGECRVEDEKAWDSRLQPGGAMLRRNEKEAKAKAATNFTKCAKRGKVRAAGARSRVAQTPEPWFVLPFVHFVKFVAAFVLLTV
jgi:hypothetical protein